MGFYEGAKQDLQRARRATRLALGELAVFEDYDYVAGTIATHVKRVGMIVGVWSFDALGGRTNIFNVDPRDEDCDARGYLLLPSGRSGWGYAFYGDLGLTLHPA
jgi:hypothetical protein